MCDPILCLSHWYGVFVVAIVKKKTKKKKEEDGKQTNCITIENKKKKEQQPEQWINNYWRTYKTCIWVLKTINRYVCMYVYLSV